MPQSTASTFVPNAPVLHAGQRVLVVDDNEDAAEVLAEALNHVGHVACVALDGPTALEVAAEMKPDIALLDIGLPGMDGFELARRLRAVPGLERMRLVAVTGYGQRSDVEASRAAGFDEHLVKPLDLNGVQAVFERWFGSLVR